MSTKISIQIDSIDFNKRNNNTFIETESFLLRRNKKLYFITSHNFLPIKNNITHNDNKLSICINSKWNELLILSSESIPDKVPVFSKISIKLPNIGSFAYLNNKKFMINQFCFQNYAFLPNYPEVIYIQIKCKKSENFLAGSPLYDSKRKILGIVSFSDENNIYCLPSYYIIKTFDKKNKIELPNYSGDLTKINRHLVKDNMIYNPYLGLNIPISCYFLLESNRKLEIIVKDADEEYLFEDIEFREYSNKELILNSRKIIRNKKYVKLTSGTLHLIKKQYPELCQKLFQFISNKNDMSKIFFKVKKNSISIKY